MIFNLIGKGITGYTVTLRYLCDGKEIANPITYFKEVGTQFQVPGPQSVSGYQFSYQSYPTGTVLTITSNITIAYTYSKASITITKKYVCDGTVLNSTTSTIYYGTTYVVPQPISISGYTYSSCSHTIGLSYSFTTNTTITYYYESAIMYLFNYGDVPEVTGGWEHTIASGTQGSTTVSSSGEYLDINGSSGYYYANSGSLTGLSTKNTINFDGYTKMYIHFKTIQQAYDLTGNVRFDINTSLSLSKNDSLTIETLNDINYANTLTDVIGWYDIEGTVESYVQFLVVNHTNGGAPAPGLEIYQIWLE